MKNLLVRKKRAEEQHRKSLSSAAIGINQLDAKSLVSISNILVVMKGAETDTIHTD